MRRPAALFLVLVLAGVLAGCSAGPGAQSTAATGSAHLEIHGPTATVGPPRSAAPSMVPATTAPLRATAGPDAGPGAAVIGQWGGATAGSPVLWFAPGGRFNGHDGCNSLAGTWVQSGQAISLRDMTMTLIGCPGMDTWLSRADSVTVHGQTLRVTDARGKGIGTLPRLEVAD